MEEALLILEENQGDFLLELDAAVSRWIFSGPDLLQGVLIRPSAIGKINSPCLGNITSLHRLFYSRFLMRPSFPNTQCLQPICHPTKFLHAYRAYPKNNPGKTFFPT